MGLLILLRSLTLCMSGDRPPCIQRIFSSIKAMIGIALKTSTKYFHILRLYLLLPSYLYFYISHKNRKSYLCLRFHGFLLTKRSFMETWFCSREGASCIRLNFFLCRHNRRWKDSYCLLAILHTKRFWAGRCTVHGYLLNIRWDTADFERCL